MRSLRAFTDHPASVGESYLGHLLQATGFGLRMIIAGMACVMHGVFPFLCVTTGSEAMARLNAEMAARRAKACGGGTEALRTAALRTADAVPTDAARPDPVIR
jgi:hypothetical protein